MARPAGPLKYTPANYMLTHIPTGVFYIGSTGRLAARLFTHRRSLQLGTHHNKQLQSLVVSWEDVELRFTYTNTVEEARLIEKKLLDLYVSHERCCNVATDPLNPLAGLTIERDGGAWKKVMELGRTPENLAKMVASKCKRIMLDGVEYASLGEAAKALDIHISTVRWGLKTGTGKYKDWKYL